MSIFMAGLVRAFNEPRRVWVFDSFRGVPTQEDGVRWHQDKGFNKKGDLSVSLDKVQDHFRNFDLYEKNINFEEGWFHETTKNFSEAIALLRFDGDIYSSTMTVLENLYDKVSIGGFIVIDDWGIMNCQRAVKDFWKRRRIHPTTFYGTCEKYPILVWRKEIHDA